MSSAKPACVVAVAGKGGSGKSLLAANIGIFLATVGRRVVLVDASLGSANLHTLLGTRRPERTIAEVMAEDGVSLAEIVQSTPVPGLSLIAGEGDPVWVANPRARQARRLASQVGDLDADYVVVDLAGGTALFVTELLLAADVAMVVVTPEPTSVEVAYRVIRAAFLRCLHHRDLLNAVKMTPEEQRVFAGGIPSPLDLYNRAMASDPGLAEQLLAAMCGFSVQLVLNRVRSKADGDLGHAIAAAARRRLGLPITYLGPAEYDEAVWASLRRKRPLLTEHPESRVAKCIERLARRLLAHDLDRGEGEVVTRETYYDLFEVPPTASFEDIRRASRRVREVYSTDSAVVTGLYSNEHLAQFLALLDEAYDTLMDAERRKAYDQELFPDGPPPAERPVRIKTPGPEQWMPDVKRPPMPDVTAQTDYTGTLLKQVREARGISLRLMAERTKIGTAYLRAIEEEKFANLPAPVYTRGFLVEYAKMVGLEVEPVLASFFERYRRARVSDR